MSYTDKCCGVCDNYIDLTITGRILYDKKYKYCSEEYKRFHNNCSNVCQKCIDNQALKGLKISTLVLHKQIQDSENITKGYTRFVDPSSRKLWRCANNRLGKEEFNLCDKPLKFSKAAPRTYEVTGSEIKHEGLFTEGGVFCFEKRKLRRVLRKLGVSGNIKHLIK